MTTRGILFSGEMVRALLANRKFQTRRTVKLDADGCYDTVTPDAIARVPHTAETILRDIRCPYGDIGDRLFVREDTWIWCDKQPNGVTKKGRPKFRYVPVGRHVVYKADGEKPTNRIDDDPGHMWKFKPGRFMPRWASRITLEITDIRVQRLQDISEKDAIAEGCFCRTCKNSGWMYGPGCDAFTMINKTYRQCPDCAAFVRKHGGTWEPMDAHATTGQWVRANPRGLYADLWESINGPGSWARNDLVWALSFKRVME
jgi:hypothetical protein